MIPYLTDRLQEVPDEVDVIESRRILVKSLEVPARSWPFAVVLFDHARFVINCELGGISQIKLCGTRIKDHPGLEKAIKNVAKRISKDPALAGKTRPLDVGIATRGHHTAIALEGVVEAATIEGAIRRVERLLDTALGGTRALGLARYVESRNPFGQRNMVLAGTGVPMASTYADRVAGSSLQIPNDLTELENAQKDKGDLAGALGRHARTLQKAIAGPSGRAEFVRNACRLAINAEASLDFGILMSLAFSRMEGLLVGTSGSDSVTAKLREAVAFSLGRDHRERESLRKEVKDLYQVRSEFVHQANASEVPGVRRQTLDLMYRILRQEMEMLPDPPPT